MPSERRYRTPDGALVSLRSPTDVDLSGPCSAFASFRPRAGRTNTDADRFGLNCVPLATWRVLVENLGGTRKATFTFQGVTGEVWAGTDDAGVPTLLAGWIGAWNVGCGYFTAAMPDAEVARYFGLFRFEDTPDGMKVDAPGFDVAGHQVMLTLPDIGLMTVYNGRSAAGLLPKFRGSRVASGEVWRRRPEGADLDDVLVHGGATTVSTLTPDSVDAAGTRRQPGSGAAQALDFLSSLDEIGWN